VEYEIIVKKRFAQNLLNVLFYFEKEWSKQVSNEFHERINSILMLLRSNPILGAPSKKSPKATGLSIKI
jgi:hypothetical protein